MGELVYLRWVAMDDFKRMFGAMLRKEMAVGFGS